MIEKGDGLTDITVAGFVDGMAWTAGFEGQGSLTGSGTKLIGGKALVYPLGAFEAVEAGRSKDQGIALASCKLLQASIDVASHLDEFHIGAKGEELGSATGTGGADGATERQCMEGPVGLTDPDV